MKKYIIRNTKMWIFFPTLILLIGGFSIWISSIFDDFNSVFHFVVFLLAMIISFSLSIFISTIRIAVTINDTGIKIEKIKGILPYKSRDIQFPEIIEYSYMPDRQYDIFKLTLRNHKHIRFVQFDSIFPSKPDELKRLVNRFAKTVDLLNDEKRTEIFRVQNFYETKDGIHIAFIFGFSILLLLLLNFISPTNSITQPGIWVAISGGGFYIYQVIRFPKKKKK